MFQEEHDAVEEPFFTAVGLVMKGGGGGEII
jgi:hypothetical protein